VHDLIGDRRVPDDLHGVIFFAPEGGGYFLEYNNFIPPTR
jgi:ubiquinol-cytochrome c reductase cytochrome b subunit